MMGSAGSNPSTRIRRWAANAALIVVSFLSSLLALEIGVRFLDGKPIFSAENFVLRVLDQVHNPVGVHYDPRVGWVPAPNIKSSGFTTGEYGVRMPSKDIVPLQQGAILMVGDSFGAGSEVVDADTWPAQLERTLATQVINAAAGGYGLDQMVLRAEGLVPLLKPRVLLIQARLDYAILANQMSVSGGAPKPYFTVDEGELVLHNQPVPRAASRVREIGWASFLGHSYLLLYVMTRLNRLDAWLDPMRNKLVLSDEEALRVTCLLMRRIAKLRDEAHIRVALVIQYSGDDALEPKLSWEDDRARILACAHQQGLEIADTLEVLRAVSGAGDLAAYQRLWVMHENNRIYGHMSAQGNRMIADFLAKYLFSHELSEAEKHQTR